MSDWTRYSPQTLFRFGGRIARAQFWFGSVIAGATLVLAVQLAEYLAGAIPDDKDYLFYFFAVLLLSIPFLAMTTIAVQRWHDREKSGWLIIPFSILPATAGSFGDQLEPPLSYIVGSLAGLPILWAQFELGLMPGTSGPNRYGLDPLNHDPRPSNQQTSEPGAS